MTAITIPSFQWWLSNDRNVGQEGAFWKSDWVEIRKNSQYVTLNRALQSVWTTGTNMPIAFSFDAGGGTNMAWELLAFTSTGKVYDDSGEVTNAADTFANYAEANGKKYILWGNRLYGFTPPWTISASLGTFFSANQTQRPWIDIDWDLIIWDGNAVARYNKDTSFVVFNPVIEDQVIWWLIWTVYAITQIWPNVYVWCNNGNNTNLYIWDWQSSQPSELITYPDKPVINVALLWAQHYWWSQKAVTAIKNILIGSGYEPTRYMTSDVPNNLSTGADNDNNRIGLYGTNTNAIETINDIVYLPGYGRIFGFGKYFPNQPIALNREFTFNGSECTVMLAGKVTNNSVDLSSQLAIGYKNGSNYFTGYYDFKDYNGLYTSEWYIESMEYVAAWTTQWEEQRTFIVPFELTNAACTIEVSVQINRSGTWNSIKTIGSTAYWIDYNTAELKDIGKWDVIQFRFDLATSNTTYSPKLRVGMTNQSVTVGNLTRR